MLLQLTRKSRIARQTARFSAADAACILETDQEICAFRRGEFPLRLESANAADPLESRLYPLSRWQVFSAAPHRGVFFAGIVQGMLAIVIGMVSRVSLWSQRKCAGCRPAHMALLSRLARDRRASRGCQPAGSDAERESRLHPCFRLRVARVLLCVGCTLPAAVPGAADRRATGMTASDRSAP